MINYIIVFIFPILILAYWSQAVFNLLKNFPVYAYTINEYTFQYIVNDIFKFLIISIGAYIVFISFERLVAHSTKVQGDDSLLNSFQENLEKNFWPIIFFIIAFPTIIFILKILALGKGVPNSDIVDGVAGYVIYSIICYIVILLTEKLSSLSDMSSLPELFAYKKGIGKVSNSIGEKDLKFYRNKARRFVYGFYPVSLSLILSLYLLYWKGNYVFCIYICFIIHLLVRDIVLQKYKNKGLPPLLDSFIRAKMDSLSKIYE